MLTAPHFRENSGLLDFLFKSSEGSFKILIVFYTNFNHRNESPLSTQNNAFLKIKVILKAQINFMNFG